MQLGIIMTNTQMTMHMVDNFLILYDKDIESFISIVKRLIY